MRLNDMSTSELITVTRNYSASIKEIGIYSELVKELTTRLAASTAAANEGCKHAARADALAAENAYLLPKAASELSNAWVLNKYWVGIHVALMHVKAGRLHDGMAWLQNTISGPGIEAPELSEFAEIEAWATEQQKDSIGHARALEIIKAETPSTDAFLAEVRASAIPEGYVLVPQEMHLSSEAMEGICFHCGDGDHQFGEFTDGLLFVGDVDYGDGKKVHGPHNFARRPNEHTPQD